MSPGAICADALRQSHFAAKTKRSTRVTLIACVVFICVDSIRGQHGSGLEHLRNGVRLLDNLKSDRVTLARLQEDTKRTFPAGTVEHLLAEVLEKFRFQAALLGQATSFDSEALLEPLPVTFSSISEAKSHLVKLLYLVLQLTEVSRVSGSTISSPCARLSRFRARVEEKLALWSRIYDNSAFQLSPTERIGDQILRSHHVMATIEAASCLQPDNEMAYDSCKDDFKAILHHSMQIARLAVSRELDGTPFEYRDEHAHFTSDMGWLPPLYYTALKCRDSVVRHSALQSLSATPSKEGLWDASVATSVAAHVIRLEEAGCAFSASECGRDIAPVGSTTSSSLASPMRNQRLSDVRVNLSDCPQGKVHLTYKRLDVRTRTLVTCKDEIRITPILCTKRLHLNS